jgi:NADPH2:quinone reductase
VRAVILHEFGPPEVLVAGEAPDPSPGPGEAVVEVERAGVTFVETQIRAGRPPNPSMAPSLPAILGNGVGGVVAAVGSDVADDLRGRRVVASLGGTGGYAQRAVAAASRLVAVPDGLPMRDAVALLADGRTALALVRRAQPRAGEVVLVEAAAGGVGTLLVQLARAAGARVVALAGGERKLAVARELGAELLFDAYREDWAAAVRAAVGAVDVAFDGVGGETGTQAFALLRPGGRLCAFGHASGAPAEVPHELARARGVTVLRGTVADPADMVPLTRAALEEGAAGRLRPVLGQELALEHAARAHAAIEARTTVGKTLLVP